MKKTLTFLVIILLTAQISFAEDIKLMASDGAKDDYFGHAVSISGNFAIVGANADDDKGGSMGTAFIFEQTDTGWVEKKKLLPNPNQNRTSDYFGWAVSISGHTAIVGAQYDNDKSGSAGAAYIYQYNGFEWSFVSKIFANDHGSSEYFGCSVSISGNTAIIGAYNDYSKGAAYIFVKTTNGWEQKAKLTSGDIANSDQFGWSVAIDGNTAIIGAKNKDSKKGAAYIFDKVGNDWKQIKKLPDNGKDNSYFGSSVSISGDTFIVGAYWLNNKTGAAYIYDRNKNWQETALFARDGAANDYFGESVSIFNNKAIIGAYNKTYKEVSGGVGAAYFFERTDSSWELKAKLIGQVNSSNFGNAVSISDDKFIVGARYADDENDEIDNDNKGAAYIYPTTITPPKITGYVMDTSNKPVVNATITASNSIKSAQTDSNGYFEITLYYNWTGILTVSKDNYQFYPETLPYEDVTEDITGQYFFIDAFTISGFITTPMGDPISGVKLTFTNEGGTATTNSLGYYSHKVLKNWTGEVFCEGRGMMYNPLRMFHKNISDNLYDQNFIGYRFTISGYCLDENNNPVPEVIILAMPGNVEFKTDSNGYFEHDFDYEWTGTLTPIKSGVDFYPTSRPYTKLADNQINQDFDASPRRYKVKGHIVDQDLQSLDNVELCFGKECVATHNGSYEITLPFEWSGDVCPEIKGYWFEPACMQYTLLTQDDTQHYTATIHQYMVSGTITDADTGQPLEYVTMVNGNDQIKTDASGQFDWEARFGSQIIFTPQKDGYVFEPVNYPVDFLEKQHPQVNFSARRIQLHVNGTITKNDKQAAANVAVKCGNLGITHTNTNGEYQCVVPYAWTGKIELFLDNHNFMPQDMEFGTETEPPVLNDKDGINFIAHSPPQGNTYQSILAHCDQPVLSHEGGSTEIDVWLSPDNLSWTAEANNTWLTITQLTNKVKVEVSKNPLYVPRTDTITIKAKGVTNSPQYIEIEQAAAPVPVIGPGWKKDLDYTKYEHMQMIVCVVHDDQGRAYGDKTEMLAAFSGNEIRGVAHPIETKQGSRFFLQVWSNTSAGDEEISFKFYDADQDQTNVNIKYPITFKANTSLGSIYSPHVLTVSDYFVRIKLNKGWNWISVNAYNKEDMSVNTVLKSIGDKGIAIVSQDGFDQYAPAENTNNDYSTPPQWYGSISQISPLKMYKLKVNEPVYLEFSGVAMDLSTKIPLKTGWNWIGYLPSEPLPLNIALKSIGSNGLVICGQEGFAMYDEAIGWVGSLSSLKPNHGYMLKMAIEDQLIYPAQSPSPRARTRRLRTTNNSSIIEGWQVESSSYEYQGVVTMAIMQIDTFIGETGDALAAFAGTECRGVATPVNTTEGIRFFLQVWSNTPNENLRLKFYDADIDQTIELPDTLIFKPDMVEGSITEPVIIQYYLISSIYYPELEHSPLLQEIETLKYELITMQLNLNDAKNSLTIANLLLQDQDIQHRIELEQCMGERKIHILQLEAGWHLIAGNDFESMISTNPVNALEVIYIYEDDKYISVDTIPPQKGAWIKLREDCEVHIGRVSVNE
ncbi:PKD domain-containing protein [Candidatus Magnetomorum sp. HK-1]|nr:PKD domain-containing protein [Candidatus Magnetomorum sp. HK-1]